MHNPLIPIRPLNDDLFISFWHYGSIEEGALQLQNRVGLYAGLLTFLPSRSLIKVTLTSVSFIGNTCTPSNNIRSRGQKGKKIEE